MNNYGLSDQVRARATADYVNPAVSKGRQQFSISVKEFLRRLEGDGFPSNHARQVCTALTGGKFLRENNVQIEAIEGPPSKTSTTVVVHYRFASAESQVQDTPPHAGTLASDIQETPEQWAHRVTKKISGILKDEIAEQGGSDAFLRWVRGYDEEDAA